MSNLDFIYNRKSIRKFKDQSVPKEDLLEMIKAATYAPSGTNSQNWHFVVVSDKSKIEAMALAVEKMNAEYLTYTDDETLKAKFEKFIYFQTLFKNAPVVILVFGSDYKPTAMKLLKDKQPTHKETHDLLWHAPGIQNLGAATENLLLAAANMGYGGCWMTAPIFASQAISDAIGFHKEGFKLALMTPIGVPSEDNHPQPGRKSVEDVVTFI